MTYFTVSRHEVFCDACRHELALPDGDKDDWDAHLFRIGWVYSPRGKQHFCDECLDAAVREMQ